ncbi:MAG TPA: diaminopimelate epimerase [Candidatus Limnocylindrales bacterium]|nr:diaminopimelate epimerase [Candidatus Limnocylindrales bacterium]
MRFWKMHGLGNDYIVIDNRDEKISGDHAARLAKQLCERRLSVGADGLLLVSCSKVADARMRIFNADGGEAEMCGNGIRCFAKYCYENGIVKKNEFTVETFSGIKNVWLTVKGNEVKTVKVDMGAPNWERGSVPMVGRGTCIDEDLEVNGETFRVTCLSMGNPHCVIFVDSVDDFPVDQIGPKIENHKAFPKRTNVGFVQVLNKNRLKVRVWERGCGETLSCGTGTCAAVAAAHKLRKVSDKVTVEVLGGHLQVEVAEDLYLSGPAEKIFEGTLFGEV